MTMLPLFLGKIGMSEILIILLVVILFFGAKKIPELMRGMGRGVKEFKDAVSGDTKAEETAKTEDPAAKKADQAQTPEEKK